MKVPYAIAEAKRTFEKTLKKNGEEVTVTQPDGTKTTERVMPQFPSAKAIEKVMIEGGVNAANALPTIFQCLPDTNIMERSKVTLGDGTTFRIGAVTPTRAGGVTIKKIATGERE